MKQRLISVSWVLIISLVAADQGSAQPGTPSDVGWVESLHGRWVDHAHGPGLLEKYSSIYRDSRIQAVDRKPDSFIRLRVFGVADPADFACSKALVCTTPLDLTAVLRRLDPDVVREFTAVFEVVKSTLFKSRAQLGSYLARGAERNPDQPQDDVLIGAPHAIITHKFLTALPPGKYQFKFARLGAKTPTVENTLEWTGTPQKALPLTLPLGIFNASVSTVDDGKLKGACVVLVVRQKAYAETVSLIEQARRYTQTWGMDSANPAETQTLLRSVMLWASQRPDR